MLHQLVPFVMKHWALASAFVIVLILLVLEEARSQSSRGEQVSVMIAVNMINREDALVVDLRDPKAFNDAHIVNAKNFPLVDFDREQSRLEAFRERRIILVDAMGLKTAPIAKRLKDAGFNKVASLKGGLDAWKTANMPTVKK